MDCQLCGMRMIRVKREDKRLNFSYCPHCDRGKCGPRCAVCAHIFPLGATS